MKTLKIINLVCAARPNFMKVAPLYHELKDRIWAQPVIVHTGQHYDSNMSDTFFHSLEIPTPNYHLGIGSGTHAEQVGRTMIEYEKLCMSHRPDMTIVVGDVNATIACALAARKLNIPVGHVEAGLRNFDLTMPEEINRLLTDKISDILWTPSEDADENLKREGIQLDRIHRVGNIMIDSLVKIDPQVRKDKTREFLGLEEGRYGLITIHRPTNVDSLADLDRTLSILEKASDHLPLVFPVHPRTRESIKKYGFRDRFQGIKGIIILEPLDYIPFINLLKDARVLITDSGGIQEECSYLNIPCLTLRSSTERPITISHGTNELVPLDSNMLRGIDAALKKIMLGKAKKASSIPLWDGKTAARIADNLEEFLQVAQSKRPLTPINLAVNS